MRGYLLDTNIVSLAMQGDRDILERLERSRLAGVVIYISGVTYFEIRRGLLAKNAIAQMRRFENLSRLFQIILLDDLAIFEQAAAIHADLKKRGRPIQTEDILIAATGMVKGLTVVSRDRDLRWISDLKLESWDADS